VGSRARGFAVRRFGLRERHGGQRGKNRGDSYNGVDDGNPRRFGDDLRPALSVDALEGEET
jgi:hypothetical protein